MSGTAGPAVLTAAPPALELRDVSAAYGRFRALFGVTMSVPAGSVTALVGPNGAGKSTIARVASGLVPVSTGRIYFGGEEAGLTGGRAKGKKVLVGVAVERKEHKGFGRCRMVVLPDASAASLHAFIEAHVEPGATIVTDVWPGYYGIDQLGYVHDRHSQRAAAARGEDIGGLLPGVHRVASLAKRWHLSTHQGRVDDAHLQSYLDEFVFRFNRRRSHTRGLLFYRLLELAVAHDPVRYRELVANPKAKKIPPIPPGDRGHPPSLDRPPAGRPWRIA